MYNIKHINLIVIVISLLFFVQGCSGVDTSSLGSKSDQLQLQRQTDPVETNAVKQFELGVSYMQGRGVPRDERKASQWFKKSAEQGFPPSQYNLGWRYEFGEGIAQSDQLAIIWYKKASVQGHLSAMNNYALLVSKGRGAPKDCYLAARLFRQAAEKGNTPAQDNLGNMYRDGCGVEKNYIKAVQWCEIAAMSGDAAAQTNLGAHHLQGMGVPLNYEKAYFWSLLAARQGNQVAMKNATITRSRLTPTQISRAEQKANTFRPRTQEQQKLQFKLADFTIQPNPIPAGSKFEFILNYIVFDPRVPYRKIPVDFHYELLKDEKVLLTSKPKTIQSLNNQMNIIAKRNLKATKKKGTYTIQVIFNDSTGNNLLREKMDFLIE